MHYFPIALPILLLLLLVAGFAFVLIEVGVLRYAYDRIGIDRRHVYLIILCSFLGSYINIPLYRLPGESVVSGSKVFFYGCRTSSPSSRTGRAPSSR